MNFETALTSAVFLTCNENYLLSHWNKVRNVMLKNTKKHD